MDEDIDKEVQVHGLSRHFDTSDAATQPGPANALGPGPGGLAELYEEHHARVFRAAYRITGSHGDAEDALQAVFLRLLKSGNRPADAGAAGYLHRAAVNAGLDLLRARSRARAVDLDEDLVNRQAHGRTRRTGADEGVVLKDELRRALSLLSPKAAEIFSLRYFEGYGNTEIARMLGTSRATIAVTLHRTRNRLKKELGSLVGDAS